MKASCLYLASALLLATVVSSCKKADEPPTDAIITGFDNRYCACCGGLMITFNGETKPYTGDFKLVDNGPEFGVGATDTFPLRVRVAWVSEPAKCGGNYIRLTQLVRQ